MIELSRQVGIGLIFQLGITAIGAVGIVIYAAVLIRTAFQVRREIRERK